MQFGTLNQQQIDFIENKAIEIKLEKDDYFSEAGKIPVRVGFISEATTILIKC